jgi:hypothetical protein
MIGRVLSNKKITEEYFEGKKVDAVPKVNQCLEG